MPGCQLLFTLGQTALGSCFQLVLQMRLGSLEMKMNSLPFITWYGSSPHTIGFSAIDFLDLLGFRLYLTCRGVRSCNLSYPAV